MFMLTAIWNTHLQFCAALFTVDWEPRTHVARQGSRYPREETSTVVECNDGVTRSLSEYERRSKEFVARNYKGNDKWSA